MNPELETEIRGFFPTPHKATACLATADAARDFAPEVRPVTVMERDWLFYVATTARTRKAREMAAHAKAAILIMFRKDGCSGYLRVAGNAEPVDDVAARKGIADAVSYRLENHWKGPDDPDLAFIKIVPERVEFMRPGEDDAKDVTAVLFPGRR